MVSCEKKNHCYLRITMILVYQVNSFDESMSFIRLKLSLFTIYTQPNSSPVELPCKNGRVPWVIFKWNEDLWQICNLLTISVSTMDSLFCFPHILAMEEHKIVNNSFSMEHEQHWYHSRLRLQLYCIECKLKTITYYFTLRFSLNITPKSDMAG